MMWRRAMPILLAIMVVIGSMLPNWSDTNANLSANRWTLTLLAAVFVFKAGLFGWMRRLMTKAINGEARMLSIFGTALVDLFAALVVFNLALGTFFGCFAWSSWRLSPLEQWQIIALRAALAGTATLVLGTGFGVAWEIRRARSGVAVHVPTHAETADIYEGVERRNGEPGRRSADYAR